MIDKLDGIDEGKGSRSVPGANLELDSNIFL